MGELASTEVEEVFYSWTHQLLDHKDEVIFHHNTLMVQLGEAHAVKEFEVLKLH